MAILIEDQFHSRLKFEDNNPLPISGLITDCPHDFGSGDIRRYVIPFSARSAEMIYFKVAIGLLVKHGS